MRPLLGRTPSLGWKRPPPLVFRLDASRSVAVIALRSDYHCVTTLWVHSLEYAAFTEQMPPIGSVRNESINPRFSGSGVS